jgi:hypothetical protein
MRITEPEEVSDNEIDDIVAEKRHKELVSAIKSSINYDDQRDSQLYSLVKNTNDAISSCLEKLQSISQPQVNVSNDHSQITMAISEMSKSILDCQAKTNDLLQTLIDLKSCEVELTAVRNNYSDLIDKIIAKPVIPKSKYQA